MTDLERVARAACTAMHGEQCVMVEHPERPPCARENCATVRGLVAGLSALLPPSEAMVEAGDSEIYGCVGMAYGDVEIEHDAPQRVFTAMLGAVLKDEGK